MTVIISTAQQAFTKLFTKNKRDNLCTPGGEIN